MSSGEKKGYLRLASKALAVITASLSALTPGQVKAEPIKSLVTEKDPGNESFVAKRVVHRFVLKLNLKTHQYKLVSRHASHSSHSSHTSYTPAPGHASHSSHISSSPTYTPSSTTPSTSGTSTSTGTSGSSTSGSGSSSSSQTNSTSTSTTSGTSSLDYYVLGSRELYKGCKGTDVEEVQKMLVELNYDTALTGYYGDKTVAAVKKFQTDNKLPATGRMDSKTLSILRSK